MNPDICEPVMKNDAKPTRVIDFSLEKQSSQLVCDDPATGQTITFSEAGGRQVIEYSYQEAGKARNLVLTDEEAASVLAWKNSGRRNSFWNWQGWEAARNRNRNGSA